VTLSECLRARLLSDGRTLGQLALRSGIPKQTLHAWLIGRRPSGITVDRAFAFLTSEGWDPAECVSRGRDGEPLAA